MMGIVGYLSAALRVSRHPETQASGPRTHILGVISGFEQLGWKVMPYIVGDKLPSSSLKRSGKEAIGTNPIRVLISDVIRIISSLINSYLSWFQLGNEVDWVYERFALLQTLGGRFKRHGVPWILESNGLFYYEAKHERSSVVLYQLARHIEISAYRNCDVLVCISKSLKQLIIEEANIKSDKIVVLPNGVDTEFFSPTKTTPIRLYSGFIVGYVGAVIPRQGLDLLIEVIAELIHDQEMTDIFFVAVGDGDAKDKLEQKVMDLGLGSHVIFTGLVSRNEVPAYIAGFDIGFSGQITQPIGQMYHSPLKIYEYMAMEKPVLASDFADARMVLKHGGTGYLFKPGDKKSLKRELLVAYRNRQDLAAMGQRARRDVIKNHSWTSRVKKLIQETEAILKV